MARLPWPAPALLAWGGAWAVQWVLVQAGLGSPIASSLACALGVAISVAGDSWWRRLIIAAGFPVSLVFSGVVALPPWGWLVMLVLLALIYPLNAWRDAPLFPTPADALQSLAANAPLADGALVLDAGCGLGHALKALRAAYPAAQLHGIESSWLLRGICALRCPWARIHRGDFWQADWSRYDMVYLFQRPESMPRAAAKASAEMRDGAWIASLEFDAPGIAAAAVTTTPAGRPLWLYRLPFDSPDRNDAGTEHK